MNNLEFPRLNWPYMAFIILVGTEALSFIGLAITTQVYREWSRGLPISGGWSWPIVFAVDFICLAAILSLGWKIYGDANTSIDPSGVSRPSVFGQRHIAWSEVTQVKVFGGVGFHLYAGGKKIVVSPYAYADPKAVIEALRIHVSGARPPRPDA